MPRWARFLAVLGIAVIACATFLWLLGDQAFVLLEAHEAGTKLPFVKQVPVELTDLSVTRSHGTTLSYFGYEFEVPWTDIDQEKTQIVGGNKAIIAFQSGNTISLWTGPPHQMMNDVIAKMKIDQETFRKVYGEEAVQSDYNFERTILETTPAKISLFSSKRTAVSKGILLVIKAFSTPGDPNSGIFEVTTSEFKGFQYGSPVGSHRRVSVELFPENAHLDLLFLPKQNGPTAVSQADINRVVQTIRKVPLEAGSSTSSPSN